MRQLTLETNKATINDLSTIIYYSNHETSIREACRKIGVKYEELLMKNFGKKVRRKNNGRKK